MPDAKEYVVQSTWRFEEEVRKQSATDADAINIAIDAIATAPLRPQPAKLYKFLDVKEKPGLIEMSLATRPRRLQILKNGFIVSYTIREYEHVVVMEDLSRHWSYKLPSFQPLLKDDQ